MLQQYVHIKVDKLVQETLAILGDGPFYSTGFAVVLSNLARELSRWFRVIYFGRFMREHGFDKETEIHPTEIYEISKTQGGVWDRGLVEDILRHYKEIDYVFSEDDYFSAKGMVDACNFMEKPFHLHTPIDSLPVDKAAFREVFGRCEKVYIPNRSYMLFNGRKRPRNVSSGVIERGGKTLSSIYSPHAAHGNIFKPLNMVDRPHKFCYVWSGRDEPRKALGRFILAFEKVYEQHPDVCAWIRTDWNVESAKFTKLYLTKKKLPVYMDQMVDCNHSELVNLYNRGDVYINTAKAGGFEMGIIEAMACEKVPIVTDHTFMNEHVIDGENGFLIPLGGRNWREPSMVRSSYGSLWGNISIDRLAEKMAWCFLNQSEVKRMGVRARKHVLEKYNWKRTAEKIKREIVG